VVFSYDITNSSYAKVHDFNGEDGKYPKNVQLIEVPVTGAQTVLIAEVVNENDVELNWAFTNKEVAGYNVYRDDQKINTEILTVTTYTDLDLAYNMDPGYTYQVETVFVEGGSNMSNSKIVKINGTGVVQGTITDADNGQPISLAEIALQSTTGGTDYTFSTDANGDYEGTVLEDIYNYTITADGYLTEEQSNVYVNYNQTATHHFQLEVAPNTQVFINPATQDVSTAEAFSTTLEISEVSNLGGFEIEILFNPDLLQATQVELGDFLESTGRTIFPVLNYIDNSNGSIQFGILTLGPNPPGPDGAGVLLNIDWLSTADLDVESQTEIEIGAFQFAEPDATLIQIAGTTNGQVNISPCFPYDFDCDCDVDILDITMAAFCYGTSTGDADYNADYDLDNDGDIDIIDLTQVAYNYGWTCGDKKSVTEIMADNSQVLLSVSDTLMEENISYMSIDLQEVEQLGGYELQLDYFPQEIEILEIIPGNLLNTSHRELMELSNKVNIEEGSIQYAVCSLGSEKAGAEGSGSLLQIKYIKKAKDVQIQLSHAQLARIDGAEIAYKKDLIEEATINAAEIIKTYPNPMREHLIVDYQVRMVGDVQFILQDVNGKILREWNRTHQELGIHSLLMERGELPSGVYFLSLKNKEQDWARLKVVIQ